MNEKVKNFLKKTFPFGLLVVAHRAVERVKNKFRRSAFLKHWDQLKKSAAETGDNRFSLSVKDFSPILHEMANLQAFDRHYIYHLAWAARKVQQIKPNFHVDISSSLHFCTIISAFIPVQFYDYRPAELNLDNLTLGNADLLSLPFADDSINSISCMHTVEHVGLGRYGDPVDSIADLKSMKELKRVVKKGGNLLFVVPVGKPKMMFNAMRVYSAAQIIDGFEGLKLKEFSLVPDSGPMIFNASLDLVKDQVYGCGCFWFIKE